MTARSIRDVNPWPLIGLAAVIAIGVYVGVLNPALRELLSHPHLPNLALLAAQPPVIRLHIAAALTALLIGTALLLGIKGTTLHRTLGWTWVIAMATVAISSFFIRVIDPGHFSLIHMLSGWTVIALPMGVFAVRRHNVRMHRRAMTGLFVGGLLIAGLFTFAPGRVMWQVIFG